IMASKLLPKVSSLAVRVQYVPENHPELRPSASPSSYFLQESTEVQREADPCCIHPLSGRAYNLDCNPPYMHGIDGINEEPRSGPLIFWCGDQQNLSLCLHAFLKQDQAYLVQRSVLNLPVKERTKKMPFIQL
ncbi:hypothetical protein J0S82_013939, partial [Galemys pyrenaicus]